MHVLWWFVGELPHQEPVEEELTRVGRQQQRDTEGGGVCHGLDLTNRDDKECWREDDTTPGPKRASYSGAYSRFMACSGAQVHNVYNQVTALNARYPGDRDRGWDNTEVFLTIGGNDLRTDDGETWPKLMQDCIVGNILMGAGTILSLGLLGIVDLVTKDCWEKDKNQIYNWYYVESDLKALYRDLRTRMPNATVAVLGYPRLMRPWHNWLGWHCKITGVDGKMALWVDEQVEELNRRIESAVNYMNTYYPEFDITFVPVDDYFDKGACSNDSDKDINSLILLQDGFKSNATFHPSQYGYNDMYDAIKAYMGNPGANFTTVPAPPTGGY